MDTILEDLPGVIGIIEDVCIHGKGEDEHNKSLKLLMNEASTH